MNQLHHQHITPESIRSETLTERLPYPLRAYQRDGVCFLRLSDSALLADEMGLGKTVQTAVALKTGRKIYRKVLLIVPTSLCLNWERELQIWAQGLAMRRVIGNFEDRAYTYRLPVQILIASYEQVRMDSRRFRGDIRFDLVIVDEAQRIKNLNSETSYACRIIPRDQSWALTGTPLENRPDDLIAIFRFLKPHLLRTGMTRAEIHNAMTGHFMRRTKLDVLEDLPPIMSREIRLELGNGQRQSYDQVCSNLHESIHGVEPKWAAANMLAVLTQLKQLCNFDSKSGESVKLEVVRSLLETIKNSSEKVLIFSQYVRTLEWLSARIDIPHSIFHGGLSLDTREKILDTFRKRSGPRALLLSLQAGGVGLNLQEASTVILFDRWWNPATENQAIQRAHRFGRKMPLQVIRFLVENSVEERIQEVLREKKTLFDEYVEDAPGFSVEQATEDQLRRILELD